MSETSPVESIEFTDTAGRDILVERYAVPLPDGELFVYKVDGQPASPDQIREIVSPIRISMGAFTVTWHDA